MVIFSLALRAIVFLSAAISRFPCCFAFSGFLCLLLGLPKKLVVTLVLNILFACKQGSYIGGKARTKLLHTP